MRLMSCDREKAGRKINISFSRRTTHEIRIKTQRRKKQEIQMYFCGEEK